ncbi:tail protein [Bacteroides phage C3_41T2LP]|nr:tail protein [Bacteroides phage C3_41T2LP]
MANEVNPILNIYNEDGTPFHDISLRKHTFSTIVMSLNDKIEGEFYYKDNSLSFTLQEYVEYKGIKYILKNPPVVVRKGMTSENSEAKGMTKYSCTFYHEMIELYNIPFTDIAISSSEESYRSEKRTFSWIGTLSMFVQKINSCLVGTKWTCKLQPTFVDDGTMSDVLSFSNQFISDVCKTAYETWKVPFVVDGYTIWFGKPSKEILDDENKPYIFKFGQGVGLKNNDCTPKNNKVITRIAGYGSNINIPYGYPIITDADGNRIEHPYTRDTLMPSVYVEAVRNKVLFGSKEPLIDYYDADSSYPTPINPLAPVFHIQEFSSIQPTIEGMTYKGQAIDLFKEVIVPEGGWDDYIDPETGEVRQSYFDVTLYPLGFDLYAQAAVTSGMTFSMKSGDTLGANYEVAVDWEDVKKNFYVTDEAGNIVFKPNGEQRDYAKYPDSTDQAITIKLTKDLDTFGTIMPSKFQQVKTGDKFVILHIEMPQAYIDKAQERLDVAMKRYMLENNMPLYDYPLSFDEHFLETNQAILAQIKPNTIVRFLYKDEEEAMALSVKEMSIQYGTNPLPTYNITLTDEVSIVLNQIGQIADGLSKLGSQVAQLQAIYGLDIVGELNKKLSRVKDDTAQGMITFLRGLKVGSYVTGSTGGIFYADTDGKSHAELDYLTVRMKAMFYALEIIKTGVIGGRQMITPGGAIECIKIEDRNDILDEEGNKTGENVWDYWRCYFYQDDGTEALDNRFRAGDMALAQDFNIKEGVYENVSNHYFWRLVVNVGTNYIDISKTDADAASDAPRVGDTICQLGNKTFVDANGVTHVEDKTRQNAIIFSAVDTFSPSMTLYAGINSYSYLNKEYVSYGVDKTTNLAYMNVYGNSYIGARDKSSYMKFDTVTGVEIKGKLVTKSGKDVEETFNSFQDQIDGVKETWYGEYTPTLTNQPAVDWNTEALKKRHEGDVFTNIQEYVDDETTPDAGKSWRWVKTGDTWGWKQIADNDTSKAYLEAAKAQKAAEEAKKEANDAKQTVTNMKDFTDEAFKDGIVDRQEAAAIEKYLNSIKSIQKSVAESYSKVYGNPLLSGTAKVELKTAYDGFNVATTELITAIDDAIADGVATSTEVALVDGRYDTFNTKYGDFIAYLNAANNFIQDKINTSAEDAKKAAEEAQKAADAAKAEAEAAKQRLDKWAEDGVISPTEKQSIKDEIVRIDADKTNITAGYTLYSLGSPTGYLNAHSNYRAVLVTLSASTPENITIPSDFASKQSAYYNQRTAALNAISDAAKAAVDTVKKDLAGYEYLKKAWKESTTIEGGVIQNALNMLGYTDPVAGFKVMSGMNGVYDATKVGGGIASWYGGSMKDRADYTEANMPSDVAKAIIRMDGSGYLASGAVWWGTDGVFHADPQSFIIKENQLGDYVSLFQIVYRSGTPKTISYMIPQYPMQKLTVSDYIEIGTTGYRIGVDSANNAIKVYKEDGSAVNFYASGAVSAKGISSGSGGGGGGLIDTVYGYSSLGGTFADSTLSDTFNAYTINKLASRITELEKNGGGGTGIAGIKVNSQTYVPDTSKYITLPNYPSTTITGTGNVLTNATYDNSTRVLTLTKGNIATTANHLERYAQITSTAIDTVSTFTASKTSVWEANGTAYGTTGANDTVLNIGSAANRLFQLRAAYNSDDFYLRGVGASSFRTWYKVLHEGNYSTIGDTRYVKKAGDTMTGGLTIGESTATEIPLHVKSVATTGSNYIRFYSNGAIVTDIGYSKNLSTHLYNGNLTSHPTLCLGLADNLRDAIIYRYAGVNYNVWHSGSLKPYQFTNWADTRSVNHVPNDYNSLFIMRGIKTLTTIGLSDGGSYATVWGWRGWSDSSEGQAWEIASTNEDLYTRHGETTSWTSWAKILNSSNYQNYPNTKVGVSTIWLYPENNNEINFGGTYTANSNIYFGYTSKDNRPKPTEYHFGKNDASVHGKFFKSYVATGTQPFQCVSTTTCTNLNADMIDGYHAVDLTRRVYINGIPGGAGSKWIRIGVLKYPEARDSNTVMITISNSYSYSMNRSVTFIISLTHHSSKPIITQLNGYPAPFSKVRILAPKDSNGSYIYGDRYVDIYYFTSTASGANNVIYLTAINLNYNSTYHFVPNKSFVDGSTIPSNYGEIWNFPFTTGLGSNANIYSQDGSIEGGTLKLSSTSTFGETATFNGGMYSGNIFPLSNNNYRIGSSSNRFIDAYIQNWVYANSGLYMNPSGITQNGSYLELSSGGNEIIIAGGTDFHVNYRGASYGGRSVPKKWHWRAGSSSSWANMEFGDCTLHGWINSTGITGSGAKAYNVGARFANTSHDSIEIVGGNYTMGLGCHSNGLWHWWRGTANPTSSTNKSYVMEYDGSTWAFTGSITATAAITAKATSDFRLKENYDGLIDYRERLLKLGRVYDYNYNKKALDLYQDRIDNKRHTGLVYQNAVKAGITNFCHEKDEYGYGSLNYLSPDLIATIIGSVQANILSIRLVESEQERMRKELEHAKSEINRLKGLVAFLQN